jgi:OFA family oxalate/formate antiporter-like MFS transporter
LAKSTACSPQSGDTFGAKFAATNSGMLYTAKGTAALLVPLASMAAAHYGWQAVFVIAVALNATAALMALFVIRPMRCAFILGSGGQTADVTSEAVAAGV